MKYHLQQLGGDGVTSRPYKYNAAYRQLITTHRQLRKTGTESLNIEDKRWSLVVFLSSWYYVLSSTYQSLWPNMVSPSWLICMVLLSKLSRLQSGRLSVRPAVSVNAEWLLVLFKVGLLRRQYYYLLHYWLKWSVSYDHVLNRASKNYVPSINANLPYFRLSNSFKTI